MDDLLLVLRVSLQKTNHGKTNHEKDYDKDNQNNNHNEQSEVEGVEISLWYWIENNYKYEKTKKTIKDFQQNFTMSEDKNKTQIRNQTKQKNKTKHKEFRLK